MIAEIKENEIIIRRISTHIDARDIIEIINSTLERKNIKIIYSFEGSPGPLGEGIIIKIKLNTKLSEVDIATLKKIFELKKIPVKVTI
ncbi:MAG: hypothetical protein DRO23_07585 [Thermoprotei archaeon]|nr:MAG: hypothetical protein DRO23_07585 [Thermoprotei archaeon]